MKRFTKEELTAKYGEEAYNRLIPTKEAYERNFPEMGEFLIVPSPHLNMLTVVSAATFDKMQNDVASIIHDKLILK